MRALCRERPSAIALARVLLGLHYFTSHQSKVQPYIVLAGAPARDPHRVPDAVDTRVLATVPR